MPKVDDATGAGSGQNTSGQLHVRAAECTPAALELRKQRTAHKSKSKKAAQRQLKPHLHQLQLAQSARADLTRWSSVLRMSTGTCGAGHLLLRRHDTRRAVAAVRLSSDRDAANTTNVRIHHGANTGGSRSFDRRFERILEVVATVPRQLPATWKAARVAIRHRHGAGHALSTNNST